MVVTSSWLLSELRQIRRALGDAEPFLHRLIRRGRRSELWIGSTREDTARLAVIKTTPASSEPCTERLRHFAREQLLAGRVIHPGVLPVLETGFLRDDESLAVRPYLATPLAGLGSLAEHEPLDWATRYAILVQVGQALGHLHRAGLVHLNLEPRHVLLLTRARTLSCALTDFSRARERGIDLARPVEVDPSANAAYAAPELSDPAKGPPGPWTDVYAMGRLALELCAPGPVRDVASLDPARLNAPAGLATWLRVAMCETPEYRYRNGATAVRALRASLTAAPRFGEASLRFRPRGRALLDRGEALGPPAGWSEPARDAERSEVEYVCASSRSAYHEQGLRA